MGTWGTGISSNDSYADIYDDFMNKYNGGMTVTEITNRLIKENPEEVNTKEYAPNFWFAIANAQWDCGALDDEILKMVERIIQSGEDLQIWKDQGSAANDIKARERVLVKFLTKIKTPRLKPKKRVKKTYTSSIFKTGDCITYIMDNGNYGGAFVLAAEVNTDFGINYLIILTINQSEKPSLSDYKNGDIYMFQEDKLGVGKLHQPQVGYCSAKEFDIDKITIEVIGNLEIYKSIKTISMVLGYKWESLKSILPIKEEYLKTNGLTKKTMKLSKLIGKQIWFNKLLRILLS